MIAQTNRWLRRHGYAFLITLEGNVYSCKHCQTHFALSVTYSRRVNVNLGEKEERMMITGMHTVDDIFCVGCGSIVGWKYEAAYEKSQNYKRGKFILERFKILGPDGSIYAGSPEAQLGENDTDDA